MRNASCRSQEARTKHSDLPAQSNPLRIVVLIVLVRVCRRKIVKCVGPDQVAGPCQFYWREWFAPTIRLLTSSSERPRSPSLQACRRGMDTSLMDLTPAASRLRRAWSPAAPASRIVVGPARRLGPRATNWSPWRRAPAMIVAVIPSAIRASAHFALDQKYGVARRRYLLEIKQRA